MDKEIKIKSEILDAEGVERAISRISHEIVEKNKGAKNIAIIGIRQRGDVMAAKIVENIKKIENIDVPLGAVDITFYRDDYDIKNQIEVHGTDLNFSVDGKDIVLVDDVLYTGRTTRAAIDVVIDHGRPKTIQLAVLVDRGHRELPIQANYVGKNVPTSAKEVIVVKLEDEIKVCLGEKK